MYFMGCECFNDVACWGIVVLWCGLSPSSCTIYSVSETIPVTNSQPSGSISGAPSGAVTTGGSTTVTITGSDPDGADIHGADLFLINQDTGEEFTIYSGNIAQCSPNGGTLNTSVPVTYGGVGLGTNYLKLTVDDWDGASYNSFSSNFFVQAANTAPIIDSFTCTSPVTLSGGKADSTCTITAHDPDAGDTITDYAITRTTGANAPETKIGSTATFTFTKDGSYTMNAAVADNKGAQATQKSTSVQVTNKIATNTNLSISGNSLVQGSGAYVSEQYIITLTDANGNPLA